MNNGYAGDQAAALRSRVSKMPFRSPQTATSVLGIASGKGGVGKSSIVVNLATQLARCGQKVLLLDADFGLGNLDIMLGVSTQDTLESVVVDGKKLEEIALQIDDGITLLPTGSANFALANANPMLLEPIFYELETYAKRFDSVLVDTGAGISERVRNTLLFTDKVVIVTSPDPTSLTDSYATIKVVAQRDRRKAFAVIVNMVESSAQGREIFSQLAHVANKYLHVELESWGSIPHDARLPQSVRRQQPLANCYPNSPAIHALARMATHLTGQPLPSGGILRGFFRSFFQSGYPPEDSMELIAE